jgi:GNAT superfamily N-acetyltransferase
MNSSTVIRKADETDIEPLVELARTTFRDAYEHLDDPADIRDYVTTNFTAAIFRSVLSDSHSLLFVATRATRYIGYMHIRVCAPPACVTGPSPIELARLYLRQDEVGHGSGAALMKLAFTVARNLERKTLWLSVYDRNQRAVEFYRRWGFVNVGAKEFLFGGKVYHDPVMSVTDAHGIWPEAD